MFETGFCVKQFIKSTDVSEFDGFDGFTWIQQLNMKIKQSDILSLSDCDMDD